MADIKLNTEIYGKIIDQLNAATIVELYRMKNARNSKKLPENLFSFIKYRAGVIFDIRADRSEATAICRKEDLNRKCRRALLALGSAIPKIRREPFYAAMLSMAES
jgi:hypothetical protein